MWLGNAPKRSTVSDERTLALDIAVRLRHEAERAVTFRPARRRHSCGRRDALSGDA